MSEPGYAGDAAAPMPFEIEMEWPLPPCFSFVQSITDIDPGRAARGICVVPHAEPRSPVVGGAVPQLSPSLITEAIGQLAGWVAMAKADFRRRPIAALAGELEANAGACSDTRLQLEVEIDRCDPDSVSYGGRAWCGERCLVELRRSVGPMLSMEEFDDPAVVERQFRVLCEAGANPPTPPAELANLSISGVATEADRTLRAEVRVPADASWFAGHFPRKPVLPGTMLVDVQARLAVELAGRVLPGRPRALRPARVRGVKLRAFVPPGAIVVFEGRVRSSGGGKIDVVFEGTMQGVRVSSARVELVPQVEP
ncbi:hypothetical protein L6Q96_13590 [Candidatus Binatia bacterium]|nr:hypothetical protein [Candidatus Binatia bacterium]